MDYEKYKNRDPFPSVPQRPRLDKNAKPSEIREHANAVEKFEEDFKKYRLLSGEWRIKDQELMRQFVHDVLEEYGILDHPKADKLYAIAWDHGHASGFEEVAYWVRELAELIKD
jgi:hypothetical protein